jgi:hypothetical protein
MRQDEAERLAAAHVRTMRRFGLLMWLVILPALGLFLYLGVFAPGYHPQRHSAPPTFSCSSQRAASQVLGDGGAIAPLCGNTPYPDAPGT